MAAPIIAAGIAAGAGLVGGILSNKAQRESADAINAENARQANMNREMQEKFAQHGIRWKVEDAKAAGIHPLYALGASTHSFNPVGVGAVGPGADNVGPAIGQMGQDISRAVNSTKTEDEKTITSLQIAGLKADLQGKEIDNAVRAKALSNVGPSSPSFPGSDNFIPGQGNSNRQNKTLVIEKPLEKTVSQPGRLSQEAGWRPDVSFARTDTGLTPMVPESLSESLEDDIIGKLMWRFRNQLAPNISGRGAPAKSQLPRGEKEWHWNYASQEWRPGSKNLKQQLWDMFGSPPHPKGKK